MTGKESRLRLWRTESDVNGVVCVVQRSDLSSVVRSSMELPAIRFWWLGRFAERGDARLRLGWAMDCKFRSSDWH